MKHEKSPVKAGRVYYCYTNYCLRTEVHRKSTSVTTPEQTRPVTG